VVSLVHGASGIGKSTLVNRFIEAVAEQDEATVLQGRCYERESVPFKAFDNVVDSLSRYLRRLPAVDAARVLPRDVEALATLFPVLRRVEVVRRDRRPRALPPDPQELRQRAFRALKEMFCRIADLEPLVIYIDDLQWSDVDSAKLLGELVTGVDRPALMLICAFRSGDTEPSAGLRVLLEQVRSSGELKVQELPLGVLSPEDSFALARALLGAETAEEGARRIGLESGGSPHVLAQLVRHVEERRLSGRASPETAKGLVSFERVLEQRLAALSSDARTLLELLSVAGRPVPEAMLTLVASFNIDLSTALTELRGHKLVRGVSIHQLRAVEVYHDTIREAVASAMTLDVLVSWHRRLAAALEATGAVDLEALTHHLLGAGDRERASLYAARAAAQAEKALAFDKAARLFGVAAEHCPDPERRRELLRSWADALVSAGRGPSAARAYVEAAVDAPPEEATELHALAGVQLLFSGQLEQGLAMLAEPLPALGVGLPESFQQAAAQAGHMWRELRTRGFAFSECEEIQCDPRELDRLDLLWGVTRSLLLHELERPLPLLTRYVFDALELGEPLRVVRGLAMFHVHVDLPFSKLSKLEPSGALDVAEALARRLDQVEARAVIAFARGLAVFHNGLIEPALQELKRAEDLYRNHCRGGAFEMRMSRMLIAHLSLTLRCDAESTTLRDWLREAEERGDRIGGARLRIALAHGMLRIDDADGALALLDDVPPPGSNGLSGLTAIAELLARGQAQLYRASTDGCRACYYRLDEFFGTPLAVAPLERAAVLLLRARLLVISLAGSRTTRGLMAQAARAVDDAAALEMHCFRDDVQLMRATIALARCAPLEALAALENVLAQAYDPHDPPLSVLCAMRAKGQLCGTSEGPRLVFRADELLAQRGVVNPRRFARLFVPGFEEMAATISRQQQTGELK
jgi:hypothetical protein